MSLLKRIPIKYKGELHDVRLINFSVDMEEVLTKVPQNIKVRDFNGRAMISMVDVKLKNMRTVALPWIRFSYRHVAFRLLVDDRQNSQDLSKGIFFFRSFSDKPLIVTGGRLLTDYNLEMATIKDLGDEVSIIQGGHHVTYCMTGLNTLRNDKLTATIGSLDRAYSTLGTDLRVTQIQREKWPIQLVNCSGFETTFFKTARFEGAFRVFETIYYDWLPPKTVVL
ncbi:MAG TPA: DUF2071 domain-containing protein [Chryseolinea sp.]|nr:DUF2071 domain-containing protein [Chryseolinea sp.]